MSEGALRVLVVDDSAVVRQVMSSLLPRYGDIQVTVAADPLIAERKLAVERPDVILLDLDMPRMDGLTFLRRQMARDPIPVVVCSGLGTAGSSAALEALEEGAVEVVAKPQVGVREFLHDSATVLLDALRGAADARLATHRAPRAPAIPVRPQPPAGAMADQVVAVAASTGGTEALRQFLESWPIDGPGLVVVQHMPAGFTAAFAARLNERCRISVREAANGDPVVTGQALIAPGNRHLRLHRDADRFVVSVSDGPLISRHRPSADALFHSVAAAAGSSAVGVIMTGMGYDGAEGLLAMRKAGAWTLAQDEATCVVFGMPKAAIGLGAVAKVAPLGDLAGETLAAMGMGTAASGR